MRNAFFLNPSPGNLFCHLNHSVLVFDVFVRSTSAQTFFSCLCSRFVNSSNSLGLIIQMNTKTEEKWRLSLPFLPRTNREHFYRNKTQSEEPEKPFSTQTDIKRLGGNKKRKNKEQHRAHAVAARNPFYRDHESQGEARQCVSVHCVEWLIWGHK